MAYRSQYSVLLALSILLALCTFSNAQEPVTSGKQKVKGGWRGLKVDGDFQIFKTWLDEDVAWIITDEERAAFKSLGDGEQRDQFVEAFWARRNPKPDEFENEFKIEHYQRIAYANTHFSARTPGWKTDRGRIYIVYGPPDKIESLPSGRMKDKTPEGEEPLYPLEVWYYRYLEGVGMDVAIDFVDICACGDYRMKMLPELKDALFAAPKGLNGAPEPAIEPASSLAFLQHSNSPVVRFPDLQALLNAGPPAKAIPFDVNIDFETRPASHPLRT